MREKKVVPAARLELARPCDRQILSLLCLPIPPCGQSKGILTDFAEFSRGLVVINYYSVDKIISMRLKKNN